MEYKSPSGGLRGIALFRWAAKRIVRDNRPSLLESMFSASKKFTAVPPTYSTWLQVEKQIENEYLSIQEKSFMHMMKAKVVAGEGARAARSVGVNPFEDNRVMLTQLPGGDGDTTFINASYMDGAKEREYIACAMPFNETTTRDFWRMIWEQGVNLIVMTNNETEQGNQAYWPTEKAKAMDAGVMRVTLMEQKRLFGSSDCLARVFRLQRQGSQDDRLVTHMHYREWLDYGIPQEKEEFLQWINYIDRIYEDSLAPTAPPLGPIVVHCFGGVGRTGTFITIHSTFQKMKHTGSEALDLARILTLMRHKRANMVQTAEQFKFCYRCVLELYQARMEMANKLLSASTMH